MADQAAHDGSRAAYFVVYPPSMWVESWQPRIPLLNWPRMVRLHNVITNTGKCHPGGQGGPDSAPPEYPLVLLRFLDQVQCELETPCHAKRQRGGHWNRFA
jgi:hypothetical protein